MDYPWTTDPKWTTLKFVAKINLTTLEQKMRSIDKHNYGTDLLCNRFNPQLDLSQDITTEIKELSCFSRSLSWRKKLAHKLYEPPYL